MPAGASPRMPEPAPVGPDLLRNWPLPGFGGDKEARGRVLVVGGTRETPGAVRLAAEAALRVGGGKVRIATAQSCAAALGVAVPEARVCGLPEEDEGHLVVEAADRVAELADGCAAVLLGPGFTSVAAAGRLLDELVPRLASPLVLDALGTAYVTPDPERLRRHDRAVVLTVNPTELASCLQVDQGAVDADPAEHTLTLARRTGAAVLCGGPTKLIGYDGRLWRIDAGNPGLAISGSGDTQSGLVAGLVARGAEPAQAAVWGGYLHAAAGDRLAREVGPVGYLAREVPGQVPALLAELS